MSLLLEIDRRPLRATERMMPADVARIVAKTDVEGSLAPLLSRLALRLARATHRGRKPGRALRRSVCCLPVPRASRPSQYSVHAQPSPACRSRQRDCAHLTDGPSLGTRFSNATVGCVRRRRRLERRPLPCPDDTTGHAWLLACNCVPGWGPPTCLGSPPDRPPKLASERAARPVSNGVYYLDGTK